MDMLRSILGCPPLLVSFLSLGIAALIGCSSAETEGDGDGDMMGDGEGAGGSGEQGAGGATTATGGAGSGGDSVATGGTDSGGSLGTGGDGTGGGAPEPDAVAVATIGSINGSSLTGTGTFTQQDGMVTLVIQLQGCPTEGENNPHGTHLHEANDCGDNGNAAGGHWPNGELIGDITCSSAATQHTVSLSTDVWTIGGDASTDITQHALMVHNGPTGTRIGCGEVIVQ